MNSSRALLFAVMFSAVILAGCTASQGMLTSTPGYDANTSTLKIKIKPLGFVPSFAVVPTGTTVTWTNLDMSPHIIVFDGVSSPEIEQMASWSYTFNEPGVYNYQCKITPQRGVIVVEEPPAEETEP